jgi:hypothetical protein
MITCLEFVQSNCNLGAASVESINPIFFSKYFRPLPVTELASRNVKRLLAESLVKEIVNLPRASTTEKLCPHRVQYYLLGEPRSGLKLDTLYLSPSYER